MYREIEEYTEYLEALLRGDRMKCRDIVGVLLENDLDVRSLYIDLFQRTLYEIGELWAQNVISVDVEHYATAITESLFPLVYPKIFIGDHNGYKAVVSCVANEYHQIGGKMVADILEMNGWDTSFLGANSSVDDLKAEIKNENPALLVLSLSLAQNLKSLGSSLTEIRAVYPNLPILVGGQGLSHVEDGFFSEIDKVSLVRSLYDMEEYIGQFG